MKKNMILSLIALALSTSAIALALSTSAVAAEKHAQLASQLSDDALRHKLVTLGFCTVDYHSDGLLGKGVFVFGQNGALVWKLSRDKGLDQDDHLSSYEVDTTGASNGPNPEVFSGPSSAIVKGTWSIARIKIDAKGTLQRVVQYSLQGSSTYLGPNPVSLAITDKTFSSNQCDTVHTYSDDIGE